MKQITEIIKTENHTLKRYSFLSLILLLNILSEISYKIISHARWLKG